MCRPLTARKHKLRSNGSGNAAQESKQARHGRLRRRQGSEVQLSAEFRCVEQPGDDLDFDNTKAEADPNELQIPICQSGIDPTINPVGDIGKATATTDPLYVLIPMFSVDNDQNPDDAISCKDVTPGTLCGPELGKALIQFFGAIPEAFKAKPLVYTQCPEPGGAPGTCTMHASRVDLARTSSTPAPAGARRPSAGRHGASIAESLSPGL